MQHITIISLGRVWNLGRELKKVEKQKYASNSISVNSIQSIDVLIQEIASVFEEKIGCVPIYVVKLQPRANVNCVYTHERDVPYPLRGRVESELNFLEDVISSIPNSN